MRIGWSCTNLHSVNAHIRRCVQYGAYNENVGRSANYRAKVGRVVGKNKLSMW